MIHRFYINQDLTVGQIINLPKAICLHIHVLRLISKEMVILFNGDGLSYLAQIIIKHKYAVEAIINESFLPKNESKLNIHLLQAISSNHKMDFIIQKAVELGVTSIQAIMTTRSNLKLKSGQAESKLARWNDIIIAACEQCGRNQLPQLYSIESLQQVVLTNTASTRLILTPTKSQSIKNIPISNQNIALLIGPEGGFTETELDFALENTYQAINIGPRILRTETAPLAAIASIQALYGDF